VGDTSGVLEHEVTEPGPATPEPGSVAELLVSAPATGAATMGDDNTLAVSGRGFDKNEAIVLTIREGTFLKQAERADENGSFSTIVRMPDDLPYGLFTIEAAREGKSGPPPFVGFVKGYTDDELAERAMRAKTGADHEGEAEDEQESGPEPRP
jgi:hypothetical protein